MNPGQKIPSTKVTVENDFTGLVASAHVIGAVSAKGSSPDLTTTYIVNNKSITSPLNNVTAPLAQIPTGTPAPGSTGFWLDEATGTTSALTVPATASGAILVNGPSNFTIESQLSANADGSNSFPTVLVCTAPAGEDLSLGRITVEPAGTQDVDATASYNCEGWPTVSSLPVPRTQVPGQEGIITSEIKATMPSSVSPGGTITSANVTNTWELPTNLAGFLILGRAQLSGIEASLPDDSISASVNGQTGTSALNDLATPLTPIPAAAPFHFSSTGTSSAINVPADAVGDVMLSLPQQFHIIFSLVLASTGAVSESFALECTSLDDQDLTLATIPVTAPPGHATLTASSPKSSVFGKSVAVPVGTSVPAITPRQTEAGGTQNVDVFKYYDCNLWENETSVPTDGTPPTLQANGGTQIITELKATLPAAVNPGTSIPATDVSLTWQVNNFATESTAEDAFIHSGNFAGVDTVSLPNAAFGVDVGGQVTASPLTNLAANPTLTPVPMADPYLIETDGKTSAITVPKNATGDLTIDAPQEMDILFTGEPTDAAAAAGITPVPWASQCTSADPLAMATINVVRPLAAIARPVPTGKVLIMRGSKGVAQGTIVKGKANVVIPGTALPVGKNTLTVKYTGDSNTLAATPKTITVVKTKTSPTLAVHVTPGKVAAGAIFPTVNVKLSGPGSAKGGKITVTAGTVHKTATLLFDGTQSVQLPPFATAGHKLIRVSYAGNANFVAKTVTTPLNVTKTGLGKFVVKVKPAKVIAKKTRATLLITLGAPDKLGHGLVTVRLAGRVIAKKLIAGTGKITLPKFPSAGRKLLHLTFTGNGSVVAKTVTHAVKVTKAPTHHRK